MTIKLDELDDSKDLTDAEKLALKGGMFPTKAKSTSIVDICKTPPGSGGPIPIPYPNVVDTAGATTNKSTLNATKRENSLTESWKLPGYQL
ncbi:MAG: hypothetical protein ACR2PZ_07350 [Pseudomonadales bacterium]